MYKRRDWLHVHGPDGGDSSDDDDSSINSDADGVGSGGEDSSDSDDEAPSGPGGEEGVSEEEGGGSEPEASAVGGSDAGSDEELDDADDAVDPRRRLEDLSEDDYDDGSESDDEELGALKRAWRDEVKAASVKGRPLRCRACEGTLILNALALRQHLASKRHRRGMKSAYEDVEDVDVAAPICWAVELLADDQEATETHGERLQRIRQQLSREDGVAREASAAAPARAPPGVRQRGGAAADDSSDEDSDDEGVAPAAVAAAGGKAGVGSKQKKEEKKGKRKAEPGPKPQRPGKRQRALLNEQLKASGQLKPPKGAAAEAKVQPAAPAAKQRNKARKEKRAGLQPKSPAAPPAAEKPAAVPAAKLPKGSAKKAKPTVSPAATRQRTVAKAKK